MEDTRKEEDIRGKVKAAPISREVECPASEANMIVTMNEVRRK